VSASCALVGVRPKASRVDQRGHLAIAKFPKETDDYSIETWEEIALRLADRAGIATPHHALIAVANKRVLLSRRFDRLGDIRILLLSATSMTGSDYPLLHGCRRRPRRPSSAAAQASLSSAFAQRRSRLPSSLASSRVRSESI
jgi:hypothetical protein